MTNFTQGFADHCELIFCRITPVSTATQSVSRLQALLSGLKAGPSDRLLKIFSLVQTFLIGNYYQDLVCRNLMYPLFVSLK